MGRYAYALFGFLMISLAGFADYRGWSLVRPTELHNLPKSKASPVPALMSVMFR